MKYELQMCETHPHFKLTSSWHQLFLESKHFFSQMENLAQTQKCLWLSHIVTFPKKLSQKVVQIKVSVAF